MLFYTLIALSFLIFGAFLIMLRVKKNRDEIRFFVEDPDDPMNDPAVQDMVREVIRTGRPMTMERGQAPKFVDE